MTVWKIVYADGGTDKAAKGELLREDSSFVYLLQIEDEENKEIRISKERIVSMREV